ncbi:MAG: DUF7453 family protein [Phycisphaerales bacterium]
MLRSVHVVRSAFILLALAAGAQGDLIGVRAVAPLSSGSSSYWAMNQTGFVATPSAPVVTSFIRTEIGSGAQLTLAQNGDAVAGMPSPRRLSWVDNLWLDDSGSLVAQARDDANTAYIVTGRRPNLTSRVRTGDAVPDGGGRVYDISTATRLTANRSGQFFFNSRSGADYFSSYYDPAVGLRSLPMPGSAMPGLPGSTIDQFQAGQLTNAGQLMVQGTTVGSSSTRIRGIWTGTPDNWSLRVRTGVPIAPGGPTLYDSYGGRMNESGALITFGALDNPLREEVVLWSSGAGQPTSVVFQQYTRGPGMAVGEQFADPHSGMFLDTHFNNAGSISMGATIRTASHVDEYGFWFGAASDPHLIFRTGAAAAGLPAGITVSVWNILAMNNRDDVVLQAALTGPGVTQSNGYALLHWSPTAGLTSFIRQGDQVLAGGVMRTVNVFWPMSDEPGWPTDQRSIDDAGHFAFQVGFLDGTNYLMVANVPTPGAAGVLVGAAVFGLSRRRRG